MSRPCVDPNYIDVVLGGFDVGLSEVIVEDSKGRYLVSARTTTREDGKTIIRLYRKDLEKIQCP
jgi:hypothetical protein